MARVQHRHRDFISKAPWRLYQAARFEKLSLYMSCSELLPGEKQKLDLSTPMTLDDAGIYLWGLGYSQQFCTVHPPSSTLQSLETTFINHLFIHSVNKDDISAMNQALLWFLETHH